MSERILPWLPDSRCYPVAQAAHFAAVTKQGWWLVGSHMFMSRSADIVHYEGIKMGEFC